MISIVFGMVLPWLLIAVGGFLAYQMFRQNGRILLRLDSIEQQLHDRVAPPRRNEQPTGLRVGTAAPDFELPDLAGTKHKLSDLRGQDLLLLFFNPGCGFCTKMAADLAALPLEGGNGRAIPLVVTTGDREANRKLIEQYGIRCTVLYQDAMAVASRFGAQGTPMGYRIDAAGRIASELAVGAESLLKLAASPPSRRKDVPLSVDGSGSKSEKGGPTLSRSRLNRDGLKAGTKAPEFRLPRIDGGELALADLRGRPVLLVFSDPQCGPCDELAPRLQQVHQRRSDLQVLMVSRRDIEANRVKAAALGLTFSIVVQKQWEISLEYAKFATPIAYLIDARGVLLSDVAIGVEPILTLANRPLHEPEAHADLVGVETFEALVH